MKKAISIILFGSMCFCLFGGCLGEAPMTKANAAEAGAGIAQARVAGREDWEPEDMFGDWSGTTKGDGTINAYSPDCILSVNSDHTWAVYVNREWLGGTWETDSERERTLALSVEYGKKYPVSEWFFGFTRKGYRFYAEEGVYSAMEYGMDRMDEASADELYGDWYGEVPSPDLETTFVAAVSVNPDGTWSSCTHFADHNSSPNGLSNAEGDIQYESEGGHLVLLDESEGGLVKKENGRVCFETYVYLEYYGDEPVEFHVDPAGEKDEEIDVSGEAAEIDESGDGADPAEDTPDESQPSADEAGQTQDIVGDWLGETTGDAQDGGLRRGAVLSLNSDHTWVSCAAGEWHTGTWEVSTEDDNRIILTAQLEKIEPTGEWYFEKSPEGCFYAEDDEFGVRRFEMSKMEDEAPDQLFNNWYGEKHLPPSDRSYKSDDEIAYAAFVSIDADSSCTSVIGDLDEDLAGIVGGSGVSGKARYVSESGHVIYIGKNRGGIIKRPDGKYRFETYAFVDRFGRGPFCFFVEPYSK